MSVVGTEVPVTQSHRGSPRAEVSDLRNIVDRLDMLMNASSGPAGRTTTHAQRDEMILELTERVHALEGEVDELRTLVNHLMTIATWQAKVTATLVGEDVMDDDEDTDVEAHARHAPPPTRRHDAADPGGEERQRPPGHHRGGRRTLDDDIDGILGTDRATPRHDAGPADFGI